MKWFYLSILLTISISVSAQHEEADPTIYSPNRIVEVGLLGKATENLNKEVRAGDRLELRHIQKDQAGIFTVSLWANKQEVVTTLKRLERIEFEPADLYEFWKVQALRSGSYEQLARNGLQMNTRQGLAEEAFEYLQLLDNNAIRYEDEYLENYLNRLAYQIMPDDLDDGRPGRIRVKVVKDYIPNASMFPNGMMFITTGLLSILDSETELIAVMAHEIAHFAMDHAMLNINAAIKRQRSAEFWSGLATVVAAGAEAYMSAKNGRRFTGELTSGTSALASMIALQINVRMGLKYSREQELRADAGAVAVLNMIDVNPMALASALQKIKDHDIRLGLYRTLDSTGTHPHIDTRINGIAGSKYFP
ncbi:MAG: M48 family metallopeptidase [Bacteroidota bacterium]